ncbi:MAG: IS1634 family transposase [Sulfurovum sp.]|nr:IS1634 family transposase [Sulfurovum sp.]
MDKMDVVTKKVDVLPMVKYYMDQLDIYGLFSKYVETPKRSPVDSAQILSIMVANIVCASQPLYRVEKWAADYMDGLSEYDFNASIYNDDQLAKKLDLLFKADRNSFMAELSSNAIEVYLLENKQIHNDSTSVTFFGQYENEDPEAVKLKHGFNKDHRPDCKQIVFGLNITADGNVPLSFELFDGNRTDDTTHIPNWNALREFLGESDFIYIADCKLCSQKNLDHIHEHGGIFITIVPKNRSEVKQFYEFLKTNPIEWQYAYETPNSRKKSETVLYKTYEGEPSKNGYRIIWVHSSAKEKQDKGRRENRIAKADSQLTELCPRLNKYNLKTKEQIEEAIKKATKGVSDLFQIQLIEDKQIVQGQIGPGKPGPNTQYKEEEHISYRLEWELDHEAIDNLATRDGIFPLITNARIEAAEVLKAYKNQPYLEKRMYTAKSILKVAPVFLKKPRRIEAMTFLYFIALMIVSLMERNIRKNMAEEKIEKLPILPNGMNTKKPTWNNLTRFFEDVYLGMIEKNGQIIHTILKGVTKLHETVLRLLGVSVSVYTIIQNQWWIFKNSVLIQNVDST